MSLIKYIGVFSTLSRWQYETQISVATYTSREVSCLAGQKLNCVMCIMYDYLEVSL